MARARGELSEKEITPGSGNVFADIGLPHADRRLVKAGLVLQIHRAFAGTEANLADLAEQTGLTEQKIDELMGGHSRNFSTDQLLRVLNALGQDVEIVVKPKPIQESRPARIVVAA